MCTRLARWYVPAAVGAGMAGVVADLAGASLLLVTVLVLVFIAVAPTAAIAGLLRGFDVFARPRGTARAGLTRGAPHRAGPRPGCAPGTQIVG